MNHVSSNDYKNIDHNWYLDNGCSNYMSYYKAREGFRILTGGDRVRRPDSRGTNGDLHDTACTVESQTDSRT